MQIESFVDLLNHEEIDIFDLVGRYFPEQGGYFAGKKNNEYYFITANKHNKILTWKESQHFFDSLMINELPKGSFVLPKKDDLLFLYRHSARFNDNCPHKEKWLSDWYWAESDIDKNNSYYVNFYDGTLHNAFHKKVYGYVRGIRKIEV